MKLLRQKSLGAFLGTKLCLHYNKKIFCLYGHLTANIMNFDLKHLQKYRDEDSEEEYFACAFCDIADETYLVLGGERRMLKVVNLNLGKFYTVLKGHGGPVIDILHRPVRPHVIFSASSDTTIRMWDLGQLRTLAIFGGLAGHEDMVLSIDMSQDGKYLVSSGTDNSIKVWRIPNFGRKDIEHTQNIKTRNNYSEDYEFYFTEIPVKVNFPLYNSQVLHKTYINCVKYYGEIIVSKNISKRLAIIKFTGQYNIYKNSINSDVIILKEYKFKEKLIQRFTISGNKMVTCDESGNLFLIDLSKCADPVFGPKIGFVRDAALINDLIFVVSSKKELFCYSVN